MRKILVDSHPAALTVGGKFCSLFNETKKVVDYQQTWRYQKVLAEHAGVERKRGFPVHDSLILVQHQSLYTLGRAASLQNLKFSPLAQGHDYGILHFSFICRKTKTRLWREK